jgi:hypothetical protein
MNGNITKEGITADLEAMKRVGVGGAQIFNVECGIPEGPVKIMSPEWLELTRHAVSEADRLGLELCLHNGPGWTCSGGPWNTPANAMQMVVTSELRVKGPLRFEKVLPRPATRLDYYRDIAVLAFPTSDGPTMAECAPKVTASAPACAAGNVADGDGATVAELPLPRPGQPQYIQFEFARPFRSRTLLVTVPGGIDYTADMGLNEAAATLQVSDDGQHFRMVRRLVLERRKFGPMPVGYGYPPVEARFYRLAISRVGERSRRLALAEVSLSPAARLENVEGKACFVNEVVRPFGAASAVMPVLQRGKILDLTRAMDKDGKLAWDVPAGEWTILRVGHTPTGKGNHPAPASGYGLECDKLSKEALDAHWAGMMQPVLEKLGPLAGKALKGALIDSYEVGGQNWTPRMREEFQKRRGYDLTPFLPVLAGRVVESPEVTERFLWDLRRTVSDLFAENYFGHFKELCHKAGLQAAVEPYAGPFESLQAGAAAELPMGEFWSGTQPHVSVKLAASVGHIYGRSVIGAESFTAAPENGKWANDPASFKAVGDLVYCTGVNRYIFHRYAHQPWLNLNPGMTMGQWGFHFDRTNTWWEQGRAWLSYCARCQSLLQSGRFVADVAYFLGEDAPNVFPEKKALKPALPMGYDYDGIGPDVLREAKVVDGQLVLASGMRYRVLVLPEGGRLRPAMLQKIKGLVEAGATVYGAPVAGSPSLEDYPRCDAEVKRLAEEIWGKPEPGSNPQSQISHSNNPQSAIRNPQSSGERVLGKGKVVWGRPLETVFAGLRLAPDFVFSGPGNPRLAYIHRTVAGAEVYFVSNQQAAAQEADCFFRAPGMAPELWHPESGKMEPAPVYVAEKEGVTVTLRLEPNGSVFVVFRKPAAARPDHFVKCVAPGGAAAGPVDYELAGLDGGKLELRAWQRPGIYEFQTAAGREMIRDVAAIKPLEVAGAWELAFPKGWGAPERVRLEKLASWTEHPASGVKYFSGTATYMKKFTMPAEMTGADKALALDLGEVKNLAEVRLNGHDLGILWKPPFRVDISAAARAGENTLEVRVTNMWCNRLIGDEQLPDDCEWAREGFWKGAGLQAWPKWLTDGTPRKSGRATFATWKYFTKDSPLLPSGLLGPVRVLAAQRVRVTAPGGE